MARGRPCQLMEMTTVVLLCSEKGRETYEDEGAQGKTRRTW